MTNHYNFSIIRCVVSLSVGLPPPPVDNSVCVKVKPPAHEDIADIETDTVSSTSSEPPPPSDKSLMVSPGIREAETCTRPDEEKSEETCSTTQDCEMTVSESGSGKVMTKGSMEMVKKKDVAASSIQSADQQAEGRPEMLVDDGKGEPVTTTEPAPISTTVTDEKSSEEENVDVEEGGMSPNENLEPENDKGADVKNRPSKATPRPQSNKKNKKKRYRCKHCAEMFAFPVQVHVHMRKVHSSSLGESPSSKSRRRSSVNAAGTNNNNNESFKANVQSYPLRSLHAAAKRRTRSMNSDGAGVGSTAGSTRRISLGHNNNEMRKERKSSTTNISTRKVVHFTCRHCDTKFPLLNQLKMHLHQVHPDKVKKPEGKTVNGTSRQRQLLKSKRLVQASKRKQQEVQNEPRTTRRVSTRSASRSADSEPETARINTRRSSMARSEKSGGLGSTPSSRRSSTRRDTELVRVGKIAKVELPPVDASVTEESAKSSEKLPRGKLRSSSSASSSKKRTSFQDEEEADDELIKEAETVAEKDKAEIMAMKTEEPMQEDENEEDTIYNDSDCMIIDTVESILYALTSKKSQTCPNCNKYCKFAGNFRLHLKACMNLDDDLELRTDEGGEPSSFKEEENEDEVEDEEMDEEEQQEMDDEEMDENEGEEEEKTENQAQSDNEDDAAVPYYQKLDYRRCWECGFIVSKFHNLSRHLKQRHNIKMGTKEMHAKQAEILRLKQ